MRRSTAAWASPGACKARRKRPYPRQLAANHALLAMAGNNSMGSKHAAPGRSQIAGRQVGQTDEFVALRMVWIPGQETGDVRILGSTRWNFGQLRAQPLWFVEADDAGRRIVLVPKPLPGEMIEQAL